MSAAPVRRRSAAPARRRRAARGSGEQLRGEIIAAAKRLLAQAASSEAMSIRAVADAVGVTPPSIYLHFADKDALLEAVVSDVFAELDASMLAAGAEAGTPLERLCAYGLAYVRFAIDHPEHYRIATMDPCPRPDLDTVLADSAFSHLRDTVTECMAAGIFAPDDPLPVAMAMWSAAHGVAALMIAKPFLPWGDKLAFATGVLRSAALGHAVNDLRGGEMSPADVTRWLKTQRRKT
jgi:AcrR family transcriptional regulator